MFLGSLIGCVKLVGLNCCVRVREAVHTNLVVGYMPEYLFQHLVPLFGEDVEPNRRICVCRWEPIIEPVGKCSGFEAGFTELRIERVVSFV